MEKLLNINTIDESGACLGIGKNKLEILVNNVNKYYRTIKIFKKGKERILDISRADLKKAQKCINKRLLQKIKLPDTIQGSRKKGSIKKNAELHAGQRIVGNLDIKDFFPSITSKRARTLFIKIGCSNIVSDVLVKLTTWKSRLPQGVPTSSTIANLILLDMDRRFKSLCEIHSIKYSFYVDDITISGNERTKRLKNLFCKIIRQEGFKVNPDKIRFRDKTERQLVTNLVVNSGKPNIPKEYRKELRAIIYNCIKCGPSTQTKKNIETFRKNIIGKINYVLSINQKAGCKLLREFQKINWAV